MNRLPQKTPCPVFQPTDAPDSNVSSHLLVSQRQIHDLDATTCLYLTQVFLLWVEGT